VATRDSCALRLRGVRRGRAWPTQITCMLSIKFCDIELWSGGDHCSGTGRDVKLISGFVSTLADPQPLTAARMSDQR
jgi:hypothetical protein